MERDKVTHGLRGAFEKPHFASHHNIQKLLDGWITISSQKPLGEGGGKMEDGGMWCSQALFRLQLQATSLKFYKRLFMEVPIQITHVLSDTTQGAHIVLSP